MTILTTTTVYLEETTSEMEQSRDEIDKTGLPDFLIVIDFEATCDEGAKPLVDRSTQEIIEFPWVTIDTASQSIVHQHQYYVKPQRRLPGDRMLTTFCTELTGITEETVSNAPTIDTVLQLFASFVEENFISKAKSFAIVTDGRWDLNTMLKGEAQRKGLELPAFMNKFINLKEEFVRCFPSCSSRDSLKGMLAELGLQLVGRHHSGLDDCLNIAAIAIELLRRGCTFDTLIMVGTNNDRDRKDFNRVGAGRSSSSSSSSSASSGPGIAKARMAVGDDTVVLRGLPWSANSGDIRQFFDGLHVKPDGVQIVMEGGRPSGMAYVQFETKEDAEKALSFDGRYLGPRYVEIYASNAIPNSTVTQQPSRPPHPGGRSGGGGGGRGRVKKGDWFCPSCGDHQFASRTNCRKCNAAKPF